MQHNLSKKTRRLVLISVLVVVVVCVSYYIYTACNTGMRYGQVVDAETGKPIEGAHIIYIWGGGSLFFAPIRVEVTTNKEGKYFVPNQSYKIANIADILFVISRCTQNSEEFTVFKDGYVDYKTYYEDGKIFGRTSNYQKIRLPYKKKNNLVKLWKE